MKVPGIEPVTSWLVVKHDDHSPNEVILLKTVKYKKRKLIW